MVGLDIKYCTYILFISILLSSCGEDKYTSLIEVSHSYVDDFLSTHELDKEYTLLTESVDSLMVGRFKIYLVSISPNLIVSNQVPKYVEKYRDVRIAYFIENDMENHDELIIVKDSTQISDYYNNDGYLWNSNYKEWLIVENMITKELTVIKMDYD